MSLQLDKIEYKNQFRGTVENCTIHWVKDLTSQKYNGDIITYLYANYLKKFVLAISKIFLSEVLPIKNQHNNSTTIYFQINNELNKIKYNDDANTYFLNVMNWDNINISFDIVKIWNLLQMPRYKISNTDIRINDEIIISPACEQLSEFINFLSNNIDYVTFLYNNKTFHQVYLICIYTKKIYIDKRLLQMNAQILELKNAINSLSNRTPRVYQSIEQNTVPYINTTRIESNNNPITQITSNSPVIPYLPIEEYCSHQLDELAANFDDIEEISVSSNENKSNICVICCECIIEKYVLVPCGHTNICFKCFTGITQKEFPTLCPTCRQNIINYIKLYS
jgi:hypothetical protein